MKLTLGIDKEQGQGLVEYALILVLVAIVVIGVLLALGPQVGKVFSEIVRNLERTGVMEGGDAVTFKKEGGDAVTFKKTECKSKDGKYELDIKAWSDGNADASVTLIVSSFGEMTLHIDHYDYKVSGLASCPTSVTVTSSKGGSATHTF